LARVALSLKPLLTAPSEELELRFLGIVGQQSLPTTDIEMTQRSEGRHLCSPSRRPPLGRGKGRDGAAESVERIEAHVVLRNEANVRLRRLATGLRASRSVRPLLGPSAGRSCQKSRPYAPGSRRGIEGDPSPNVVHVVFTRPPGSSRGGAHVLLKSTGHSGLVP
jgi:hypothetical protein